MMSGRSSSPVMHDACEDLGQNYLQADIIQSLALLESGHHTEFSASTVSLDYEDLFKIRVARVESTLRPIDRPVPTAYLARSKRPDCRTIAGT